MTGVPGSEELKKLVLAALSHGLRTLGKGNALEPALIVETGTGERTIRKFTARETETAVRAARKAAKTCGGERVVVCWNGTIVSGEQKHHAVYALAQEVGLPRSLVFVQRHSAGDTVEAVGNPGFVGENEPLLS